jgi:hypothetical protein
MANREAMGHSGEQMANREAMGHSGEQMANREAMGHSDEQGRPGSWRRVWGARSEDEATASKGA